MTDRIKTPWVLVAGDFRSSGGMDKANWILAQFLLQRGTPVHFVAHSVDTELANYPGAVVHLVPKPLGAYFLGGPLLDRKGRGVWRVLRKRWPDATIVANGGNCVAEDVNWSHFVQAAWNPDLSRANRLYRLRWGIEQAWERRRERLAYQRSRLVITNSHMTSRHVRRFLTAGQEKVRCVYLGTESEWEPVTEEERALLRREFEVPADRQIALFVGALGADNRKGFDVIAQAWKILCEDPHWRVDLWVAGSGPGLAQWEAFFAANGLESRVRRLGYRNDIPALLGCADLLVSAPRYEPYGLNVQEALARGVPVVTSTKAGVSERFPEELRPLLCENPDDPRELAARLRIWQERPDYWRRACTRFGGELRRRGWTSMAREMVELIERGVERPVCVEALPVGARG